jgi:hypothetical protein
MTPTMEIGMDEPADTPKIRLYKALTKAGPYDWAKERAKMAEGKESMGPERIAATIEAAYLDHLNRCSNGPEGGRCVWSLHLASWVVASLGTDDRA